MDKIVNEYIDLLENFKAYFIDFVKNNATNRNANIEKYILKKFDVAINMLEVNNCITEFLNNHITNLTYEIEEYIKEFDEECEFNSLENILLDFILKNHL